MSDLQVLAYLIFLAKEHNLRKMVAFQRFCATRLKRGPLYHLNYTKTFAFSFDGQMNVRQEKSRHVVMFCFQCTKYIVFINKFSEFRI